MRCPHDSRVRILYLWSQLSSPELTLSQVQALYVLPFVWDPLDGLATTCSPLRLVSPSVIVRSHVLLLSLISLVFFCVSLLLSVRSVRDGVTVEQFTATSGAFKAVIKMVAKPVVVDGVQLSPNRLKMDIFINNYAHNCNNSK
jgi:hypothetical protein